MVSQSALLLVLLALATYSEVAQGITNEGNEFFLMVPPVKSREDQLTPQILITTSEDTNVTFTVSYNSPSHRLPAFSQSFTASKGAVTKVDLPIALRASTTSTATFDISVNVKAEDGKTIVVYLLNEDRASTDIALLYPKFATKTNTYIYYAMSAAKAAENLRDGERSFVGIVATEDNCVVEVTPTARAFGLIRNEAGRNIINHNSGVLIRSSPLPLSNNVIFLSSEDDLTGTKVTGSCYLSVITGHQCAFVPANVQSCDGILEQIPPIETWGFNFFLSPLAKRISAGYRFIAGADNTVVTRVCNGTEPDTFTLARAGNFRQLLMDVPTYCYVESNQPLLVAQYSLGQQYGTVVDHFADPFLTLIAPVGQFNNEYSLILVQSVTDQDAAQPVVFDPYLNLVLTKDCCQRTNILYDGQPLPSDVSLIDITCDGEVVCGCAAQFHPSVSSGAHTIGHTQDSCGMGATLYAFQDQNSYGSLAGTRLDSIAATIYCLKESSLTVSEGDGVVKFTATRTGTVGQAGCIGVTVMDISTQGSSDVGTPSDCCFAAGQREAICNITIVSDETSESDEMFNIRLDPEDGQCICEAPGGPNITVTIVDAPLTVIRFENAAYETSETVGSFNEVRLVSSEPFAEETQVTISFEDISATGGADVSADGVDYGNSQVVVTFAAGATFSSFASIPIKDDGSFPTEGDEQFKATFEIPSGDNIQKGEPSEAVITITEEMLQITVDFDPVEYNVSENNASAIVFLKASSPASFAYNVTVTTQDGTATAGEDYTGGSYTATFLPGSTTSSVSIPIINDNVLEVTEFFTVGLSIPPTTASLGVSAGPADTATVNIVDNDSVAVQFNPTQYTVTEGDGEVVLTLVANAPASFDYTVQVDTSDGAAEGGSDFQSGGYPVTFPAGQTTATVAIPITNDAIAELPEDFSAVLTIPPAASSLGVTKGAADTASITILDNDPVEVNFNPTQYTVGEGDGVVTLALTADKPASFDYTVEVLTQDGTASAPSDYQAGPYSVTFPAGSTTATVNVTIEDDNALEGTESFTAIISTANTGIPSVSAGTDDTATISIEDDEVSIEVVFNPTQYNVSENDGEVVLTLVASQPAAVDYTVQVDTVNGAAVGGLDFQSGSYPVTFLAGQTTATVAIPIINDAIAELPEDFSAVLTIPPAASSLGVTKGAADTASITILDNDPVEVVFNPTQYTVGEGDGVVTLTLTADKPASFDYTVEVLTQDGTATAPSDYQAGPYSVTFPAGSTTATVNVTIKDDNALEGTESFTATISTANTGIPSVSAGTDDTATISIEDDEVSIEVVFNPTQYNVSEDDGEVVLTLVASQPAAVDYTVQVDTVNGAAVGGLDFQSGGYPVTFLAGQTTATVAIPITNDTIAELPEDFSAVLTIPPAASSLGVTKGAADTASITILDNDPVEVNFNPTQYTVGEGDGVVTLTLTADKPASFDYTVEVLTQDGTATAPSDYQAGPYSVTFPAGSTTATVNVTIKDDNVLEGTESFTATISTANTGIPSVSAGTDDTATISIEDDEALSVEFDPTEYTVSEADSFANLTVKASVPASFDYDVVITTEDITTTAGSDYFGASFTVTIPAGQTQVSQLVPIIEDVEAEGTERFQANLAIPSASADLGVTLGDGDIAVVDILDDDGVVVQFSPTHYTVSEDGGEVALTLVANLNASFDYTVEVNTVNGAATGGVDFQSGGYTATFSAGQTTATVTIPITDDMIAEGPEDFSADLIIPTAVSSLGVNKGVADTARINIIDNDAVEVVFNPTQYTVNEGAGVVTLTLSANKVAECNYTVEVLTQDGSAKAPSDYLSGPYNVTFPAGSTMATVDIIIVEDEIYEANIGVENFTATISNIFAEGCSVSAGDNDTATVFISDNEDLVVQFNPVSYTVSESSGSVTLMLETDKQFEYPFTVDVDTADGTAVAPGDYISGGYIAEFNPNSQQTSVPVIIIDDTPLQEGAENFTASITISQELQNANVRAGPDSLATVNIQDLVVDVVVEFDPDSYVVNEAEGVVSLTLVSSMPLDKPYTVQVTTVDGTATSPDDYVGGTYDVRFDANTTTAQLQIPINNDMICEEEEEFFGNLVIPAAAMAFGVRAGSKQTATVSILDDDIAEVQFDPVQYVVREDAGNAVLQLVSSRTCQFDYNVTVEVSSGNATVGSDFGGGPFIASFPAGSAMSSVNVPILDDQLQEDDETFSAQLQIPDDVPDSVVSGANATAQVVIKDNEADIVINFNPTKYEVSEGAQFVELTLVASRPAAVPYSINVTTMDGTAQDLTDYIGGSFVVEFPAGQTTVMVQVPINDDSERCECVEIFKASFEVPDAAAMLGVVPGVNDTADIFIIDDESCPISFNPEQYSVAEEAGTVEVCLMVERNCIGDFSVMLETIEGSAKAADYGPGPFTVTFAPNQDRACTNIPIVDDEIFEGDQTFYVDIIVPPEVPLTPTGRANITIVDDDTDVFCSVTSDSLIVDESVGTIDVELTINREVEVPFVCTIETQPMSAEEGEDFMPIMRDITFQPQESTTQKVQLEIVRDNITESTETLRLVVTDVNGQQAPMSINITIIDPPTMIGDPLYEVPLSLPDETVEKFGKLSLCYEVHGQANKSFNLLSDICISVNAFYSPMINPSLGNIVSKIGVLAEDSKGACQQIEVDWEGCTASVNGKVVSNYYQNGVRVIQRRGKRVRIAAPNCGNLDVVMWVVCEVRQKQPMIKIVISGGINLRPGCHGLIGQFWHTEVSAERYNVTKKDNISPDASHFAVTVKTASGDQRRFFAALYARTWDFKQKPCLYAGSSQGGKTMEVPSLSGSVIEGLYKHYITDGLFNPKFEFSQFQSQCPTKA